MASNKIRYWWCNTDGSDKVYATLVRTDGRCFAVWGARLGGLSSKEYSPGDLRKKIIERDAKKYREFHENTVVGNEKRIIESVNNYITAHFVTGFSSIPSTVKPSVVPAKPVPPPAPPPPMIVECINCDGLEDQFQLGIEYLVKGDISGGMMVVENMLGDDVRVMQERFKIVKHK